MLGTVHPLRLGTKERKKENKETYRKADKKWITKFIDELREKVLLLLDHTQTSETTVEIHCEHLGFDGNFVVLRYEKKIWCN